MPMQHEVQLESASPIMRTGVLQGAPHFALPCMRLFCLGSASPIVAGVMAEGAGAGGLGC
jgi:hypothetical protein